MFHWFSCLCDVVLGGVCRAILKVVRRSMFVQSVFSFKFFAGDISKYSSACILRHFLEEFGADKWSCGLCMRKGVYVVNLCRLYGARVVFIFYLCVRRPPASLYVVARVYLMKDNFCIWDDCVCDGLPDSRVSSPPASSLSLLDSVLLHCTKASLYQSWHFRSSMWCWDDYDDDDADDDGFLPTVWTTHFDRA